MPPPSTPPDIWSAFHSCCYRHACASVEFSVQGSELFVAQVRGHSTLPFRCTGPWTINLTSLPMDLCKLIGRKGAARSGALREDRAQQPGTGSCCLILLALVAPTGRCLFRGLCSGLSAVVPGAPADTFGLPR